MNKDHFKGTWNILKGRAKQAYAGLVDDELKHVEGCLDEEVGIIQRKLGSERDRLLREINALFD